MDDEFKTKQQLVTEINEIRRLNEELKAAEAERSSVLQLLRDSETMFRSVAQSAVDAIISTDSNDRITFWNQGAERIFGYSEKEVIGKSVTLIIPEPYRIAHRKGVENFLKTRRPILIGKTVELEGLRKGGIKFPMELSLSTWDTKDGTFFAGIIRDISDRKEAQRALEQRTEEARQRTEELESLIHMVAHDLKSPIISITGLIKRLKAEVNRLPREPKIDQVMDQLITLSSTVERFLGDLLNGLAIESTKPERTCLNFDEVVNEAVRHHHGTLNEKGIKLNIRIDSPLPVVSADKRRIAQVLDNLISNAIRHMGQVSDPIIGIQVLNQRNQLLTRISDNGVGIPPEFQNKIFERFFKVTKTGSSGGTGLGLAIAKKIIESHGGRIWCESTQGQGATFSFTLPIVQGS